MTGIQTRKSFIPAYYQLAEDIKNQIESGKLIPGQSIPTEQQLGKTYGISRMTVRKGVGLLVEAGLVQTVQGKGIFVAEPSLNRLTLLFQEKISDDHLKILDVRFTNASKVVMEKLKISDKTKVFVIKHLILEEKRAVAINTKYLPYVKGSPSLENELKYVDIFRKVINDHNPLVHKVETEISATCLGYEEAKLLDTHPGSPALNVTTTFFTASGQPSGVSNTLYRGDRYKLKASSYPYALRV